MVDKKELWAYIHNKKDFREVDFGEEGAAYVKENICYVQAAPNNKFLMLGVPSNHALLWPKSSAAYYEATEVSH